jgi:hypothetical protein
VRSGCTAVGLCLYARSLTMRRCVQRVQASWPVGELACRKWVEAAVVPPEVH